MLGSASAACNRLSSWRRTKNMHKRCTSKAMAQADYFKSEPITCRASLVPDSAAASNPGLQEEQKSPA